MSSRHCPTQAPVSIRILIPFFKGNIWLYTQISYLFEVASCTAVSFGFTEGSGSGVASFFSGAGVALRLLVRWWGEREWLRLRSRRTGDNLRRGDGERDLRLGTERERDPQ